MSHMTLNHICKCYQEGELAVKDFNLDINEKEFIVFVGPSGCGKSTVLRMIAGLEEITSGELWVDGKLMNYAIPRERNVSMVFQNYALYPNMTIYDNMAFSMSIRKVSKKEIKERVIEIAQMLGIEELLDRRPAQLSGGQKQRVAIGSAILRNPNVFLMDEPLSNLDAKMRAQMRVEIANLYEKLNTTFIYVTHDQTEAMTLGTRIVVLKEGVIQQIDTPQNLYEHPASKFVAGFIGSPAMNFVEARVSQESETFEILGENQEQEFLPQQKKYIKKAGVNGEIVTLGIRPRDWCLEADLPVERSNFSNPITVKVDAIELLGANQLVYFQLAGEKCIADVPASHDIGKEKYIRISMNIEKIQLFDLHTEESIWRKGGWDNETV